MTAHERVPVTAHEHIHEGRKHLMIAARKLDSSGGESDFGAWTSVQAAVAALDRMYERELDAGRAMARDDVRGDDDGLR